MFQALNAASLPNKYQVPWLELDAGMFGLKVGEWINQLDKAQIRGGPSSANRIALAQEFYELLHIYKGMLTKQVGAQSPHVTLVQSHITTVSSKYKAKFKADLKQPAPTLSTDVSSMADDLAIHTAKRDVLLFKKQVIKYWLTGVQTFNPHLEGVSLKFQYLGNAEAAKVRLFLDVLVQDADNVFRMPDPRPRLKTSGSVVTGAKTAGENGDLTSVTWTDDAFKKAIKAEFGASYGVRASGACELEITGLKMELKAEAFAGASIKAEGEASIGVGRGVQVKGSVEAMVGVKIKLDASVDVADIFLIEASAEAFAGALASAEVEVSATVDGIAVKLAAEAFAGARIKGKAGLTLKMFGYEIIKGEAEGFLAAGIGANFKLEFSASAFGGAKFAIGAGLVVGVGAGGEASFKVYPDNLGRVANSMFYLAYLTILGESKKKYAWSNYFRNLEDNEILFKKADELLEKLLQESKQKRETIFASRPAWRQLESLAAFRPPQAGPAPVVGGAATGAVRRI